MNIGLLEVIRPYFFADMDLGPGVQNILALLHVDEYDAAWDDDAVVISGVARIDSDDPNSWFFSPQAGGGALANSPGGSNSFVKWNMHDVAVRFRITIARRAANALNATQVTVPGVQTVLGALGPATGTDRSDYPNTQFKLELMFELVSVTFPRLIGAKLNGFLLVPDPDNRTVTISLPRLLLILTQDSGADTDFDVTLGSFGAETLDEPDPAIMELIRMNPPFALFPSEQFGFGFKKAVMDFSDSRTPPDLLDRFGIGDDWKGIFLPEVRFFVSTQRSAGTAYNFGARDLLIGFQPDFGIWGAINFDVDFRGEELKVGLRLYSVAGARLDPELIAADPATKSDRYQITVPSTPGPDTENYVLFVDVLSGAAPFVITAVSGEEHPTDPGTIPDDSFFDDPARHPEDISVLQRIRLFSHDQRVSLRITSRNPAQRRIVVLDVHPDFQNSPTTQPRRPEVPRAQLTDVDTPITGTVRLVEPYTDNGARLRINPENGELTVDGVVRPVSGAEAQVDLAPNSSHDVVVNWTTLSLPILARFSQYFQFNHPQDGAPGTTTTDGDLRAFVAAFDGLPESERIVRVDGYASREAGSAQAGYNRTLSERRVDYLISLLVDAGISRDRIERGAWGNDQHPSSVGTIDPDLIRAQVPNDHSAEAEWENGRNTNYDASRYWVATASLLRRTSDTQTYRGTLHRDAVPELPPVPRPADPPAPQGQTPDFLRHLGVTVQFEHDIFPVGAELRLTVDFKTAHERGLERFRNDVNVIGPGLETPEEQHRLPQGDPNPEDGVVECRVSVVHDPSTGQFTETLVARASESDRDGLWSWGEIPRADSTTEPTSDGWRDLLGFYFTLAPLLAETASDAAAGGDIVPLVVTLAAPVTITTLGVAHVLRVTHHGIELNVRHDGDEVHASLLCDVETAIWLNLRIGSFVIVANRPDKPLKVRYRAVGFAFDAPPDRPVSFLPVFDSSRGYTIDIGDSGSLRVLPSLGSALGDIIQIVGARIARTNPLNLEVELGLGVDLGVVSVDRIGFRQPLDPFGPPTITALGVGINIPNVLIGRGYLQIQETGFAGQLDLTLPSVKMRVAGSLAIGSVTEGDRSATSTMVTIAVELPTGIPLGGTGLAIFGFLGLFAMHRARNENPSARNPALDWFVNSVNGDPTDIRGWSPKLDEWSFGVGLVAGTIEGGTVLNLKGMFVLSLPGPRVLLFVKGQILTPKPPTRGTQSGTLLAVVDISPQRVLIGIQFEYHIQLVLDIVIPAEAGFFYDPPAFPPEHFYVEVGSIARPITARILNLFDATAYFMVHGDGIPDFPLGALQGFAVATGFRASFTWGNTRIGLYLTIAAGFDIGIGFKPLLFTGRVFIDGKLRLFIVSIEVHGELTFRSNGDDTLLEGRICGRVSFFFFSVKGCVGFSIGTDPSAPPVPDPIRDLLLQSRSPALVEGTGVDRGIDNVLCHGTQDGSVPRVDVRENNEVVQREVFVPIDTIPLVQFEVAPELAAGATIDGQLSSGLPPGFAGGWQKRGENYLQYTIRSLELRLVAVNGVAPAPGTPPVTVGPRPYTWRHPAQAAGSDGLPVELALLDWKPTNVDKALVQGPALDSLVDSRWGDVCTPVAKAARVMWTFRSSPLGPSHDGWVLEGEPWPDDPDTRRSVPVETRLRVKEIWRTNTILDGILPTIDATVVGISTPCPQRPSRPTHVHTDLIDRARLISPVEFQLKALTPIARNPISGVILKCIGKVLQAPYESLLDSSVTADPELRGALVELEGLRRDQLRDVVRLIGGPFLNMSLLIFARSKMVESSLFKVRAFAPGGAEIPGVSVSFTRITTDDQLPPRWTSLSGPWWDDVALTRALGAALVQRGGWAQYLVTIKLPQAALKVDIGVTPLRVAVRDFGMTPPSYYLAVVDALSEQEVQREGSDQEEADDDSDGLGNGLENHQHALLLPNAQYEVVVHYDGDIGKKRDNPEEDEDPNEIVSQRHVADQVARRTFFTDREPPRNISPWMLAEFPSPGEQYHFYEEPVVLVFATDDVLQLYGAYGKDLRAIVRAASFRGSEGTPEADLTQFVVTAFFQPIGGAILSPWDATVRRRLGGLDCGSFDPDSNNHGRTVLPFLLDPLTDYVLDLEMLNPDGTLSSLPPLAGEVGTRPLYRQGFTTSRYATRAAFAEAVGNSLVRSIIVEDPAPLLALTERVTDEVFDAALLDSGLEAAQRPTSPRVTVLWNSATPAEPVAVLIETPEPLWRTRLEPEAQHDETGEYILSWTMSQHLWLSVDELVRAVDTVLVIDGGDFVRRGTGTKTTIAPTIREFRTKHVRPFVPPIDPPPAPPVAIVERFVRDAGGTRTLVILKPGVRGRTLSLGLARELHPLLDTDVSDTPVVLCEIELGPPAWEELS